MTTQLIQGICQIKHTEATEIFAKIRDENPNFLFESKDISPIYGRLSLIGIDPILHITGKDNKFTIETLNERGLPFLKELHDLPHDEITKTKITGTIEKDSSELEESKRSKRKNIAQVIRHILDKFKIEERTLLGLYGAFSYDFVRLFEDIESKNPNTDTQDFNLFLFDTFVFFDHLKEKSEIILFRQNQEEISRDLKNIQTKLATEAEETEYKIENQSFNYNQEQYEKMVETAKEYCKKGELFEVVFSQKLTADFKGDPFALYLRYREVNPSPYLFYFDFQDQQLVGASPEMMIRCENNQVHLRPISGTAKRGTDPIADHENMKELLNDEKERAELDMLIDLGRNDLSRICKAGIKISDYRFVEKYSAVMHTVAHLTGELEEENTALDALIACVNAGTLTGAPKVAAMQCIEEHENQRRDYYGGTIGYLTFSGVMDSGIIIRTAHIKNDKLTFQVGATLLYDSNPAKEYEETLSKAAAFLNLIKSWKKYY
ncbi:anthranilate synthase component I family protein [Candidatus Gracilibacteria bacterium]|nr:anthranilate synthase component I family protein [Candidatus Gracilibacteria bacterium]